MPSFFTKVITWWIKPHFSNKSWSYKAMALLVVSCTLNKPTITCLDVKVPSKQVMTNANVFTSPLNIQISKLQEIIITNAKFGNMCKFMVFVTILGIFFSTRDEWKGNTMQAYQCNTNLSNQIFLHEDKNI